MPSTLVLGPRELEDVAEDARVVVLMTITLMTITAAI
jgi:hypothetical protein